MTAEILNAVRTTLANAGLWRNDAVLLIALSGGADSVTLLHALCRLRELAGFTLYACHVQHALRGESSREDERFVRKLCASLDVPLRVTNAGLCGSMEDAGIETRAREARRRIFIDVMELLQADALLLAHHRDDQTETVLMHLLRGAGADGLCGMRAASPFRRGVALRPLLSLPKQTLLAALEAEGLAYREDESNLSPVTARNALRLSLLPAMERLFPESGAHIAQAAQTLAVDADCLYQQADTLYISALLDRPPIFALEKRLLLEAPEALARRVLRRWFEDGLALRGLQPDQRTLSYDDTLALLAFVQAGADGADGASEATYSNLHVGSGETCAAPRPEAHAGACGASADACSNSHAEAKAPRPASRTLNLPCGLCAASGSRWLHLRTQDGEPLLSQPLPPPLSITELGSSVIYGGVRISASSCLTQDEPPRTARSIILSPDMLARSPILRTPLSGDRIHPFGASGSKPLRRYLTDHGIDPEFRASLPVLAIGSQIIWIPALCTAEALRTSAISPGSIRLEAVGDIAYIAHQSKE